MDNSTNNNYFKVTRAGKTAVFLFDGMLEASVRKAYSQALSAAETTRKAMGEKSKHIEARDLVSVYQGPRVRGVWDGTILIGEFCGRDLAAELPAED